MCIHFDNFYRILSLIIHVTHLLLNWSGFGPCTWSMSSRACLMGIIFFSFIKPVPFLASYADNITTLVILDITSITPLWVGGEELGRMEEDIFLLRYMMPPAREHAFNLHRYDASDWIRRGFFAYKIFNIGIRVCCCVVMNMVYSFFKYF